MPSPTELRDGVSRTAPRDPEAALAVARTIRHPWFRAQALAEVARHVEAHRALGIARDALAAAARCDDDFGRSAVTRWIIGALAERGHVRFAAETLHAALETSDRIEHPGSRAEAWRLLREAAEEIGTGEVEPIAARLVALARTCDHWRVGRALVRVIAALHRLDPAAADGFTAQVEDEKLRAKIARTLEGT